MVLSPDITLKSPGELLKHRIPELYPKPIKLELQCGRGVGSVHYTMCLPVFWSGISHFLTCSFVILPEVLA